MASPFYLLITVSVFFCIATTHSSVSNECVYTLYAQTGSGLKSGTDSKISATLGDSNGQSVSVPNLESWGLMGQTHDYFERANLDIFTGGGPCLSPPLCSLNLTSDGSGSHHGWFCDFIDVTATGPHMECSKSVFYVGQWLANDAPPYQLTAVLDGCHNTNGSGKKEKNGRFVVDKPIGFFSE